MALDRDIPLNFALGNMDNPTPEQLEQANKFADMLVAFVMTGKPVYISGLSNSGGPVVGDFLGGIE